MAIDAPLRSLANELLTQDTSSALTYLRAPRRIDGMRRVATMVYCIASLLAWLAYGPFFHAHTPRDGGELHAHFEFESQPHAHGASSEMELPHEGHHGVEVSVFSGQIPNLPAALPEITEAYQLTGAPVLRGFALEQPVRAHDPPARLSSAPRSPPA